MRGIPGELKVILPVQLYTSLKSLGTREIAETVKRHWEDGVCLAVC